MTGMHHARDPQAAEIAAAAARLAGTPEQFGERLRALLDAGPPKAVARETPEQRVDRLTDARRHEFDVAALRHRLASDFAESRGLTLTAAPLAVKELARRASPGGNWHKPVREWLGTLFVPTFYRDDTRRAAAMVAHPLAEQVEQDRAAIEAWAAERDLAVTFPDFPSWHDPIRSVLAVFEPAAPLDVPMRDASARGQRDPDTRGVQTPAAAPPTAPDLDALRPGEADEEPVERIDTPVAAAPTVMRPVAPIDLGDAVPRDLADEEDPDFDVVDPTELLIDEGYQRGLSPKSLALIRRIVENWSWSKFKVPTVVRVDGRLHVLDGQHSAIAAATHPGIQAIPVLIAKVPDIADRARAFVSHARNRLQATQVQLHRAALTAGDEEAVALDAVCRAAGVDLLPFPPSGSTPYAPRQTVAVVGIRRLIERRGAERATEILAALAAADLAPISGDHLRIAETLLCDPAYAEAFDAERLTAALRGLPAKIHVEARELAIAQRLAPWRALAAVLYRNSTKPKPRGRAGTEAAQGRRRAGA